MSRPNSAMLMDKTTFTTTVMTILFSRYGMEFVNWDPLTTSIQVKQDFRIEPPTYLRDKIQAGCTLFSTNSYFVSLEAFTAVTGALNRQTISSDYIIPADVDDCAWSCTEARLLLGEDYVESEFSHNVALYIGTILNEEGFSKAPKVLGFAEYPSGVEESLSDNMLEDEIMFRAYWDKQQDKVKELDIGLKKNLLTLLQQLKSLELKDMNKGFIDTALENLSISLV